MKIKRRRFIVDLCLSCDAPEGLDDLIKYLRNIRKTIPRRYRSSAEAMFSVGEKYGEPEPFMNIAYSYDHDETPEEEQQRIASTVTMSITLDTESGQSTATSIKRGA